MNKLFSTKARWFWVRGGLAVIFGLILVSWFAISGGVFSILWGCYAVIEGSLLIFLIASSYEMSKALRICSLIVGVLGIVIGVIAVLVPFSAIPLLVFIAPIFALLIGGWAMLRGLIEIWGACAPEHQHTQWSEVCSGMLWIVIGILFVINPFVILVELAIWVGILACLWGAFALVSAALIQKKKSKR